ncbi:hypothetical protein BJ138DRAFT_1011558 [Hygrophoropsis aurantiaca]|uniref:Uncharacterized protein n=1 Tax=Hygrophoropsis aurantiaca TaxID=72124 RepID=A0ACB8A7U4_9AGAM|nr:hypothetical protein BJ138DRAFT_1011558 [Hygrophoropsis aurantiaca]
MERPVTSKSRGTCRYYNTSRGCYAGAKCKFLHGEEETHTPYDKAKSCRFYQLGYCKRGDQCWFQHELSAGEREAKSESSNDDTCNICLDKPTTYGLLTNCSHVFCQQCIRQWRDPASKTSDVVVSGVIKKCPLCRSSSRFITPSTYFYASGDPRKQETVDKYRESMARVPCKYFEETKSTLLGKPSCPFGSECFYKHENADGTSYVFGNGANISMGEYRRRRNAGLHRDSRWQNSSTAAEFVQLLGFPMDNIHTALDIIQANFPAFLERIGIGETEIRRESETRADPTAYTDLAPLSDDGSDDAEEELEHIGLTVSYFPSKLTFSWYECDIE